MKNEIIFITSTGTDIGKTYYLTKKYKSIVKKNVKCHAIKPIVSGFNEEDPNNDTYKILQLIKFSSSQVDSVSPWRFKLPLSPNIASKIEGRKINFQELVNFCKKEISIAQHNNYSLLIEGAGGIMTPINDEYTYIDLIKSLNIKIHLVVGNYLGTISQSLTAIEVMKFHKLKLEKIIFNARNNHYQDVVNTLVNFSKSRIEILNS